MDQYRRVGATDNDRLSGCTWVEDVRGGPCPCYARGRRLRGIGLTRVLAVAAALVVVLAAARFLSRPRTEPPTPRPTGSIEPVVRGGASKAEKSHHLFADVTEQAGLLFVHECGARGGYRLPEEMGSGGAFFDYDNDGDMDIYLVQSGVIGDSNEQYRNRLFRNDGSGHFEDVSRTSGADVPGYGMGCAAADYDNDGDVDLFVTRLGPNVLLRNNGDGTFSDVTIAAGVGDEGFGTAAAFLDYDRDGFLDLYVANYVKWSAARAASCYDLSGALDYCSPTEFPPAGDLLYRNTGKYGFAGGEGKDHLSGGTWFEDVTVSAGIAQDRGNGLGVVCTDFDGDGWIDIYVANDQTPAFLWINNKDGTFRENALLAGCAYNGDGMAIAGMGLAAEDLDDDGDFDLLVTNIRTQAHLCLRNSDGFFEDVSYEWGLGKWSVPYTGFGLALFDQNHNGALEGFVANGAVNRWIEPFRPGHPFAEGNHFVRRDAQGRFYDASAEAGLPFGEVEMSRGAIVGDYDNDGDLDVLVTNNRGPVQLLRNENSSSNAWTMLDLLPANGARHAINALVEAQASDKTFRREVRPHVGYLGSNDPRVHIGLGRASRIDRLTVRWPDGRREVWDNLPINQTLVLRQGQSPAVTSGE